MSSDHFEFGKFHLSHFFSYRVHLEHACGPEMHNKAFVSATLDLLSKRNGKNWYYHPEIVGLASWSKDQIEEMYVEMQETLVYLLSSQYWMQS